MRKMAGCLLVLIFLLGPGSVLALESSLPKAAVGDADSGAHGRIPTRGAPLDSAQVEKVVMSNRPESSAGLLLTEQMSGRFFVRDREGQLVGEFFKPEGRALEIGLEPGAYTIFMDREEELLVGTTSLESGDRIVLRPADFEVLDREPTSGWGAQSLVGVAAPGRASPPKSLSVAGRHRIELRVGRGRSFEPRDVSPECSDRLTVDLRDLLVVFSYSYWAREKLAADVTFRALVVEARSTSGPSSACETAVVLSSALFGIRYYPFAIPESFLRPYLSAAVGPYLSVESTWDAQLDRNDRTRTRGSFGTYVGGGLDVQMGRYFMVGFNAGYHFVDDFSDPVADRKNYSGPEYGIGFSIIFG